MNKIEITDFHNSSSQSNPRVTVLMPLYNNENTVAETVESIIKQDYDRWELLVVDDSAIDNGVEIVKDYAKKDNRIRVIKNKKEKGIVGALNTGLLEARGEYIVRIDGDDIAMPNRLGEQVRFMDKYQYIGVAGSWVKLFGSVNNVVKKMPTNFEKIKATMLFYGAIYHPSVIFRKQLFLNNGYFYDYNFQFCEDYELWSRIADEVQMANIPKVLLNYRVHNTNVGTVHNTVQAERAKIVRLRNLAKLGITPTPEESDIHEKIAYWNFPPEKDFIIKAWDWLKKIIEYNNKSNYYHSIDLAKFAVEKWLDIYKSSPYIAKDLVFKFIAEELPVKLSRKSKLKYAGIICYEFLKKLFKKI